MRSARIVYLVLQLAGIALFTVGLLSDDPTIFLALGAACFSFALIALLARERNKPRERH